MKLPRYSGYRSRYGYSSQTWLSKVVNAYLHRGSYFCWFSKRFNPMVNGDDSNPIWIYLILDRAVNQGGVNNAKIKDVRANLLAAIDKELRSLGRAKEIPAAFAAVNAASLRAFTPQLWRLDLHKIRRRYSRGHQYRNEFRVTDLKTTEFTIIVE